jgi:hypothetical protein
MHELCCRIEQMANAGKMKAPLFLIKDNSTTSTPSKSIKRPITTRFGERHCVGILKNIIKI